MRRPWLALVLCTFIGAASALDRSALLGTWHLEQKDPDMGLLVTDMTFEENGTFHGFVDVNGKRQWNFGGKWVLSGDWLHYHYTKSDMPQLGPGTKDRDRVLEISEKKLRLVAGSGEEIYVRKGKP